MEAKFLTSTKREPAFISKGFTYWKEGVSTFKKHQTSATHKEATEAVVTLPKELLGDIGEVVSSAQKKEKEGNRRIFLIILQNLSFLARQGIPLRRREDMESNFHELMLLRCYDCPEVKEWMKRKTNKYTSHDIQNECLQIMALQVLRRLSQNIRESACYSIMADECTDVANNEQFTICIRWVDEKLEDHEDFIGLYKVDNISAESLTHAIKDTLVRMNVSLSQCRGQCYDGASNMSGSRNGVAAKLALEEKCALYTHCYGHALNLAVSTTMKKSKVCCDAMEVALEITKLVKFSPKRNVMFDKIKARLNSEGDSISAVGIRSFCPTRWTVKGASIGSILENYSVLKLLWEESLEGSLLADIKGRIIGMKVQMSEFHLLFGLHLCERILKITDNLSVSLQAESMSAADGQAIAEKTIQTLKDMRSDSMLELFWKYVECMQKRTDTNEPLLPRKRKAPKRLEIGDGECYFSVTVEDHYRQIYFEALDLAVTSIQDRFDQPGYVMYKNLEQLFVKAANKCDYSVEFQEVITMYGDDFNESELSTQLQIFGSSFSSVSNQSITLKEGITFLRNLSSSQRVFYKQVCWLARLILVLPGTNAASEQSFSTMKRVKGYLRSTMQQTRLNHLMIIDIYKDIVKTIDLSEVAKEFVGSNENRLRVFGHF